MMIPNSYHHGKQLIQM